MRSYRDRSGGPWTFWQLANNARVPGVSGGVDLNAFRGDANALRDFTRAP